MGKTKGHIPMRTCVACGLKSGKNEFIRFVLDREDYLVRDERGTMPGRGAYVCNNKTCRDHMMKKRSADRAFRGKKRSVKIFFGGLNG